jgi:hypothetical protein
MVGLVQDSQQGQEALVVVELVVIKEDLEFLDKDFVVGLVEAIHFVAVAEAEQVLLVVMVIAVLVV